MKKIKEIIRLCEHNELSIRQIARAVNISRPVVKKYITLFHVSGLTYEELKPCSEEEIYELFFQGPRQRPTNTERYAELSSQFEYFNQELKKTGVTLQKLWEEYIEEYPHGYSRSQFFMHFKRWKKCSELSMHIEHKAGDKLFVDFTGKKLYLIEKESGEKREVEVFVAILPASGYTFVYATKTQKTEDWIRATEEAFWYFGGSTEAITPDCYKSAIKHPHRYDPEINPQYSPFAEHYDTVVLPARPFHARDKALVENAVRTVYQWIYASLRNQVFYTLGELNQAIFKQLELYNAKKMQQSKISRREWFENIEKDSLKPLPFTLYEKKCFSKATIQSNYHVLLSEDKCYYSVPYQYYSESLQTEKKKIKAELYYTSESVEIYFKGARIAVHKRGTEKKYYTKEEHMPENHRRYYERWDPEKLIAPAKTKGPNGEDFIEALLQRQKHPEQSYNTCRGIIFLSRTYGSTRLDTACKKALYFGYYAYKAIQDMLKNNKEEMEEQSELFDEMPKDHANLRGKEYFQEKIKETRNE